MSSKPIPIWSGTVDAAGKLRLEADGLFRRYVQTLKNKAVRLVLKPQARPKSHNQLGYLFSVLYPVFADSLGYREYEVEQVHDACMRKLRGLQPDPNPLGLRVSLATMTHEEVSDYIEDFRHFALTEYGCVTPDAEKAEVRHARRKVA